MAAARASLAARKGGPKEAELKQQPVAVPPPQKKRKQSAPSSETASQSSTTIPQFNVRQWEFQPSSSAEKARDDVLDIVNSCLAKQIVIFQHVYSQTLKKVLQDDYTVLNAILLLNARLPIKIQYLRIPTP